MTTTVTIEAHCAENEEVVVRALRDGNPETFRDENILLDGQSITVYAYDYHDILVFERARTMEG